mgnify:CR=1 FL=1
MNRCAGMLLLLPVLAGAAWAAADAVPAGRSRIDRALPVDHAVAPVAPLARAIAQIEGYDPDYVDPDLRGSLVVVLANGRDEAEVYYVDETGVKSGVCYRLRGFGGG